MYAAGSGSSATGAEAWIVVVRVEPPSAMALFQALVEGEEGLAVVRCRDPERIRQELWTTEDLRDELKRWLATLPEKLSVEVLDEYRWGSRCSADG
ncbi:MAG: DUF4911 domain-containing protein [Zetaproteobacteria bacterium]|nr:MAG: DUF4911 domain-containing protein [Zetaproteobacteria bacterium]